MKTSNLHIWGMQREGGLEGGGNTMECWNVRRHNFKKQAFCHTHGMTLSPPVSFSTLCQKVIPKKAESRHRRSCWRLKNSLYKVRPCYYSWVTRNHNMPTILVLTEGLWITSVSITGVLVIVRQVPENHRLQEDSKSRNSANAAFSSLVLWREHDI